MNSNFTLLNIQNISKLGTDVIEKFFYGISVKEILELSVTNTRFNEACKRESFWKKKVLLDYGVEKKYGETWKETAKFLYDSDMINLKKEWINGETYGDLFEQALKSNGFFHKIFNKEWLNMTMYDGISEEEFFSCGYYHDDEHKKMEMLGHSSCVHYNGLSREEFLSLGYYHDDEHKKRYIYDNSIPLSKIYVYPENVEDLENVYPEWITGLENVPIEHLALQTGYPIDELRTHGVGAWEAMEVQYVKKVVTRELSVIMHAAEAAKRIYGHDWQNEINELQGGDLKTSKEIESLVDPVRYVILYSLQTLETLNAIKLQS